MALTVQVGSTVKNPIYLGVNVDHIATVRQARGTRYPDPVHAALQAEIAGADGITMHLREDRRHIQDRDVEIFAEVTKTKLNFEMAATEEMHALALRLRPRDVCLVPEKREELTTEGGLDVVSEQNRLTEYCARLAENQSQVSLFIDPDERQIEATLRVGAPVIEIHTGAYAEAATDRQRDTELERIRHAAEFAAAEGLIVNAGHGLHYHNVQPIARIPAMNELNIGHSIMAQAMFCGLDTAVADMKRLMIEARD
ncbi:MAG: pyridoxine 5'-phosphate synthase [Gammaproteobacteria bacterium]|nr:pyridoxine 5'-phosphate synthase [Gammaproteobacteria bacterium]